MAPHAAHRDYVILGDLLAWLREVIPETTGAVLDFGCGESPYRPLFHPRTYHRADLPGAVAIDWEVMPGECIGAGDGAYGTVLSTQVLEHVDSYEQYLRECNRVLTTGGHLVISTHGQFEEHGFPGDYRRWTLRGLTEDLIKAGFQIIRGEKLTLGPRALLYLLGSQVWKVNASRKTFTGCLLSLMRRYIESNPARWNRLCDRHFASFRFGPDPLGQESLYVGIAVLARKP